METDAAETARRRYGNGTEAAQGMVRKQYGVRHGSSTGYGTETAERRHGDGRAAARRRQGDGYIVLEVKKTIKYSSPA